MIRNVLQSIEGVSLYAVIALILFLSIFIVSVVLALRMRKSYAEHMANLPLEQKHESS